MFSEDSQEGFSTVYIESGNGSSNSDGEIIDLTNNNNNNDDITVMEEVIQESTVPQNGSKKSSRNLVINQMSENMWWRTPHSKNSPSNIRATNSSDTNNIYQNLEENRQTDDDSDLFRIYYVQDDNKPVLKTQNFICSDETILTGYRPNIIMNEKKLATAIKQAIGSGKLSTSSIANNINSDNGEEPRFTNLTLEQNIIRAIFGRNGITPNINTQTKDIVNIYLNNKGSGIYIIKCIVKEIHKGSLGFGSGLNLLGTLNFCFNSSFIKSFEELIDEFQSNNLARESICKLLGRLYNTARDSDDYEYLKDIPKFCCEKIEEWMGSDILSKLIVTQDQFKNVRDFLKVSIVKFKSNDGATCRFAYDKAKYFCLDNQMKQEIKNECVLILDLFAQKFLNNESQDDIEETNRPSLTVTRLLPKGAFSISKSSCENNKLTLGGKRRYDYQFRNF